MSRSYVSIHTFTAVKMTRGKYCETRGWDIPLDENPKDKGYFITYPDGSVTWVPKDLFEASTIEYPSVKGLEPYQNHLLAERAELNHRLGKLDNSMKMASFALLPFRERELLLMQSRAMHQYLARLNDRAASFYTEPEKE